MRRQGQRPGLEKRPKQYGVSSCSHSSCSCTSSGDSSSSSSSSGDRAPLKANGHINHQRSRSRSRNRNRACDYEDEEDGRGPGGPYAYRITGFNNEALNGDYFERNDVQIFGQATFWNSDLFMYYQPVEEGGRWAISPHFSEDGVINFLEDAQNGGKKGMAFQHVGDEDAVFQWMEFCGDNWLLVELSVEQKTKQEIEDERRNAEAERRNAEAERRNAEAERRNAEAKRRNTYMLPVHQDSHQSIVPPTCAGTKLNLPASTPANCSRLQCDVSAQADSMLKQVFLNVGSASQDTLTGLSPNLIEQILSTASSKQQQQHSQHPPTQACVPVFPMMNLNNSPPILTSLIHTPVASSQTVPFLPIAGEEPAPQMLNRQVPQCSDSNGVLLPMEFHNLAAPVPKRTKQHNQSQLKAGMPVSQLAFPCAPNSQPATSIPQAGCDTTAVSSALQDAQMLLAESHVADAAMDGVQEPAFNHPQLGNPTGFLGTTPKAQASSIQVGRTSDGSTMHPARHSVSQGAASYTPAETKSEDVPRVLPGRAPHVPSGVIAPPAPKYGAEASLQNKERNPLLFPKCNPQTLKAKATSAVRDGPFRPRNVEITLPWGTRDTGHNSNSAGHTRRDDQVHSQDLKP